MMGHPMSIILTQTFVIGVSSIGFEIRRNVRLSVFTVAVPQLSSYKMNRY